MDTPVFLAVLIAAAMHAGWNAVVKTGIDRFSSILLLALVQALIALPLLPFVTQPQVSAYAWIVASAALHVGYKVFLIHAYKHGDLTQVYPLARGAAPMLVALYMALVLADPVSLEGFAAIAAIAGGVVLMTFKGGALLDRMHPVALAYALGTAALTASYTIVDGIGARAAGTASGFILWMVVGDAIGMVLYGVAVRGRRLFDELGAAWKTGAIAGALSLGSYWVAVWAMTKAPIALVAALRETSVMFAMVFGALFLREPLTRWRWVAAVLISGGVVAMRL
jgi:drug/metabolite transporter (DMT)-like permease